jgi:cysteine desulfurase
MTPVYLDFNASTPIAAEVTAAMRAVSDEGYGNPSSAHWAASAAKQSLEASRAQVADLLGCRPQEIVFTSGGSEANNLAIKGVYFARRNPTAHIITSAIEHPSVLAPCGFLEGLGARVTRLPVDRTGRVDPEDLRRIINADTILISLMHANNEVGTLEPIEECARIARAHGVNFHTDAAQTVGKIATRVDDLGVDLLTLAGHKVYAPKGVGALYVRDGIRLESLIHGGGHEGGRRAGTESALLAAGLGAACTLARNLEWTRAVRALRDELWNSLRDALGERVVLNGHTEQRLPNTLNVSFVGRSASDVLAKLDGIAASTGSACHSGRIEISPVLRAMGVPERVAKGAIRFSLGRTTTRAEVAQGIERVLRALQF